MLCHCMSVQCGNATQLRCRMNGPIVDCKHSARVVYHERCSGVRMESVAAHRGEKMLSVRVQIQHIITESITRLSEAKI